MAALPDDPTTGVFTEASAAFDDPTPAKLDAFVVALKEHASSAAPRIYHSWGCQYSEYARDTIARLMVRVATTR